MAKKIGSDVTAERFDLLLTAALVEALPKLVIRFGSYGLAQHFVESSQADAPVVVATNYVFHRDQKQMQRPSHISDSRLSIRLEV